MVAEQKLAAVYADIIRDELNVKDVIYADSAAGLVSYSFKPQLKTLGPKFGKQLGEIRNLLAALDGAKAKKELDETGRIRLTLSIGDVELTVHCAAELLKRAPDYDYLIAPEAKAIPLIYEMARQSGAEKYFIARKVAKAYMSGVFEVKVKSITTAAVQRLIIDSADAEQIRGKRMLILDDVISTGESMHAMEELVTAAGGIVAGRMAVLAEGDAIDRDDIIVLAPLPLFNPDGTVKG